MEHRSASLVDQLDGGAVWGGVLVTPLTHGGDQRPQIPTLGCKAVLVAGGWLL